MNIFEKFLIGVGTLIGLGLIGGLIFYLGWVNFIENYEAAFMFDRNVGKIVPMYNKPDSLSDIEFENLPDSLKTRKIGWVITKPIIQKVYTVDTRPFQICISANSRVLNCKLISFNPTGYEKFFDWHGIKNYPLNSMNSSSNTNNGDLKDILMSYAYDPNNYNYEFLNIIKPNVSPLEDNKEISKPDTLK